MRSTFIINQTQKTHPFAKDENAATVAFNLFIKDKDYGNAIGVFRFDIYIEPEINFGNHTDNIYLHTAHLSAHINYEVYIASSAEYRHKLLLNAAFVLSNYLKLKVTIPKHFDVERFVLDYTKYLTDNNLLLTEEELQMHIIKPFQTTKFKFAISTTAEVKEKKIRYDLVDIEDFINNRLSGQTFGTSIQEFFIGYEIYDFTGYMLPHAQTANLKRYSAKYKNLLIVKQFDYNQLKDKTAEEQFSILKTKIIEAIDDIDLMSKKPRDFNRNAFKKNIEQILDEYKPRFSSR